MGFHRKGEHLPEIGSGVFPILLTFGLGPKLSEQPPYIKPNFQMAVTVIGPNTIVEYSSGCEPIPMFLDILYNTPSFGWAGPVS